MLSSMNATRSLRRLLQQQLTRTNCLQSLKLRSASSCAAAIAISPSSGWSSSAVCVSFSCSSCCSYAHTLSHRSFSSSSPSSPLATPASASASAPASAASTPSSSASSVFSTASASVSSSSSSSSSNPHLSSSLPMFSYTPSVLRTYRPAFALSESIHLLKCLTPGSTWRDQSVQLVIRLSRDAIKGQQHLRGVVALPNGTGARVTVAVFAKGEKANEARAAGADYVGEADLVEKIQKGSISFDRCLATPDMMGIVSRVARILGPKGLMPNPKLGTITVDLKNAVKTAKAGQVQYKTDKFGNVHTVIGKLSFASPALAENIHAFVVHLQKSRPSGMKGAFIENIAIKSTYTQAVPIDLQEPPFLVEEVRKGAKAAARTASQSTPNTPTMAASAAAATPPPPL